MIQKLNARNTYYEQETLNYEDLSNSEEENETESHVLPEPTPNLHVNWRKFTLVTGEAGCGKSQLVCASVQKALEHGLEYLDRLPNRNTSKPI